MNNDRILGITDPLLGVPLCPLCAGGRRVDCALFLSAGRNAGAETVFLHRRRAFHAAFGAMAIAAVLGLTDDMPLTLGVTVVCAVLLLRTGQNTKI